ncbi:hypothetical protein LIER_42576 [Lithospermum erythrorhizon]|uniref:Uncharacterized protein n=1 Tax=Lithospermum erythrorhizon TaxID=34254 RepID=A0AAV3NP28_LITER
MYCEYLNAARSLPEHDQDHDKVPGGEWRQDQELCGAKPRCLESPHEGAAECSVEPDDITTKDGEETTKGAAETPVMSMGKKQ